MLFVGRQRERTCQTLSRRAFLQAGASTVLGLSLTDWLRQRALGGAPMAGSARSVLLLWLWGGPAHMDTWDPKPDSPVEFRGLFSPIATKVPGIRICELFPQLAQLSDTYAIIRSLHTGSNDHGVAGTIGLTGSVAGALNLGGAILPGTSRPATGSVVARVKGAGSALPPYLVIGGRLHQGKKAIAGEGGGTLGALYDPFRLEYDPGHGFKSPSLQLAPELTPERLGDRQRLMQAFDELQRHAELLFGNSIRRRPGEAVALPAQRVSGANATPDAAVPAVEEDPPPPPDLAPAPFGMELTRRQATRLWRHIESIEGFWESLKEIEPGQVLLARVDDPTARLDVQAWCALTGNDLLATVEEADGTLDFFIRKK